MKQLKNRSEAIPIHYGGKEDGHPSLREALTVCGCEHTHPQKNLDAAFPWFVLTFPLDDEHNAHVPYLEILHAQQQPIFFVG